MKKIVLAALVVAGVMVTSCKKEAKDVVDAAKDAGTTVVDGAKATGDAVVDGAKAAGDAVVDGAKAAGDAVVDGAKAAGDALKGLLGDVKTPTFKDPKVAAHIDAYATYANDYIAAKGDVKANAGLAKRAAELATEAKTLVAHMDDATKADFNKVKNAIMAKMAPAK